MTKNKIKNRAISATTVFHRVPDMKKILFEDYGYDLDDLYNSHFILYCRKYYGKWSNHDEKGTAMGKIPTKVWKLPTNPINL